MSTTILTLFISGQSSSDCPEVISKKKAKEMNCTNWEFPDKYGHYRVAKYPQLKLHYRWLLSYIYHKIVLPGKLKSGFVIMLEEDYFVSPDMLQVNQAPCIKKLKGFFSKI